MTWKVLWKEGTFIRPQHFQQQERFLTNEITNKLRALVPYFWGIADLKINTSELAVGNIALDKCNLVFPDGASFYAPDQETLPSSIKIPDSVKNAIVYLTVPEIKPNAIEVGSSDEVANLYRYLPLQKEVSDNSDEQNNTEKLLLGELRVRIQYEEVHNPKHFIPDGYSKVPIARIVEVIGGKIELDDKFIPCSLSSEASKVLSNFFAEFESMINTRAVSLAQRVSGTGGSGGVAEVTDFMLLQLLNRLEPTIAQIRKRDTHPYQLYLYLVSFAGELATFMSPSKRPINFPEYNHALPTECFNVVMNEILSSFSVVLEEIASAIPLSPPKNGIRAARITNRDTFESGYLVLGVKADVGEDVLITQFPAQIKIGPGEKIYQLVQSALPGIKLVSLPQVPREIPYHAGFKYFELSKHSPLWEDLKSSKGMAFHVSGNFPGLEMQLWSINRGK